MKKVLAISYSQTGQLNDILNKFLIPFLEEDIDRVYVEPASPFPFPWTSQEFFNAMPESVLEKGAEIVPLKFKHTKYDLIIIGYQPWFLSPSIPATSLLKYGPFLKLLQGTPVCTVIGSRNMWIHAHESIRKRISKAGGIHIANIPLIDRSPNLISALTILHWMLKGKKDKMWGIFPKPGIKKTDIDDCEKYGNIVFKALTNKNFEKLQHKILSLKNIGITSNLIFVEERGKMLFKIWAKLISKKGTSKAKRDKLLIFFKYYLIIALFVIAPIVLLAYTIIVKPLTYVSRNRKKRYYCSV